MLRSLRLFFLICGHVFVVLAIIGVFLPIVPTTPFVLLASACYARSSKRFHALLRTNRWFGGTIIHWEQEKSIALRAKILAISMIALGIGVSLFFVPNVAVKILLIAIGTIVSLYIATRPTPQKSEHEVAARP